jgi:hypothetical protein
MSKIEKVSEYSDNKAPAASKFGVGATNINQIKEATDARRRHSDDLTSRPIGPRTSGNHDSK